MNVVPSPDKVLAQLENDVPGAEACLAAIEAGTDFDRRVLLDIVRDVGAFLSRGEAQWRYGGEPVPTAVAAIAWELVACDMDPACTPRSRFALSQCAYLGRCSEWRYEDAVALFEPPELMASARRLRVGILRALREHDWEWLGLG